MNKVKPSKKSYKATEIINLCKSGLLSKALKLLNTSNSINFKPNLKPFVFSSLLQTLTKHNSFTLGVLLHSHIVKSGLFANPLVANSLFSFYFKTGSGLGSGFGLNNAAKLFSELGSQKDVISWTCMITGYVKLDPIKAIGYFCDMLRDGVLVDCFTLSAAIKACSEMRNVRVGKCFHGVVIRGGFEFNCVIGSALIDMYGKNGCVDYGRFVFDGLFEPDTVCWSAIVSCFTRGEFYEEGLVYFCDMLREARFVPDEFTYGTVLTACGNLGRLMQGKEVHAGVIKTGFFGNVVVESSLVDMYGKCGRVEDSQRVFDRMRKKNTVSWGALLNGYCQNGYYETVFRIVRSMVDHDIYSFGTIIRACVGLTSVRHGKEVHSRYLRTCGGYVVVESALIDLYAKCGCIDYAERVFIQMPVRNSISWNSMICGYAQNGRGLEAIGLFENMIKDGFKPDYVSFIGVIFACSHAGLVDEGRKYFASMTVKHGIKPGSEHYRCMVDLLGRAGLIEEAENLIEKAECKDSSFLWPALLGACTTSRNYVAVERIALKMMEIEPRNHLSYVHLINVYKASDRWNDALKIRKLMDDRGVKKLHGKSWVDNETNPLSAEVFQGDIGYSSSLA